MNIEAQKMRFETVEEYFAVLKKNRKNKQAIERIEQCLNQVYGYKFEIMILETKMSDPCFVMSVFPSVSTLDKLVEAIINEESVSVIYELWQQNKVWNIEIDRRVLDDTIAPISAKECTALLLHEVGHTIHSNAIPNRIARILKYQYATLNSNLKAVFKNQKFSELLKLPIMDSCTTSAKKESKMNLRPEIYADNYAKKLGYGEELDSVMGKLISSAEKDPDKSMSDTFKFSVETIENFKRRRGYLNSNNFKKLSEKTPSAYAGLQLAKMRFLYSEGCNDTSVSDEVKLEMTSNLANKLEEEYYLEFFFSKRKLKKLNEYDIDYISVESDKIKTHDDKLLMLSYTRSKIDTVEYYISILKNDKYAKKYDVPHSMEYLVAYRDKLNILYSKIMSIEIKEKTYSFTPKYPVGYEG